SSRLDGDYANADGVTDQAGDAVDVEGFHELVAVGFDRADTDLQSPGDLFGAQPFGDEVENLTLTCGEGIERVGHAFLVAQTMFDQAVRGGRRQVAFAARHGGDGGFQVVGRGGFDDVAQGAGAQSLQYRGFVDASRQNDDAQAGHFAQGLAGH